MRFQRNLLATFLLISLLEAAPEGFTLIDGSAMPPVSNGRVMTIESGAKAIIDWNRFSVGAGEIVQFNQLNQNSSVLNRVTGSEMSEIFGQIHSNGMVYLVNPHGVLIGAEGQILTSGFIASTLDVLNADFMAGGDLIFAGNAEGQIYNMGTIRCPFGDAILIGRVVRNEGAISAPNGVGGLAASVEVLVKQSGNARIFVQAAADSSVFVEQAGTIEAMSAEMRTGYSPYSKGINHPGITEATAVAHEGGRIYLVAEGSVSSVGGAVKAPKGEIQILGDRVAILEQAWIDASSDFGGGTVLVGGDFRGSNASVLNAEAVSVAAGAKICANSRIEGNGGKVIVWGNETNGFYGSIEARGGPQGGDGGFVEVSGKMLEFRGIADRSAPLGNAGTLLLDPADITVSGADANIMFAANTYTATAASATIDTAVLATNLGLGPVTIDATAGPGGAATGNVTFTTNFTWAAANLLTVLANAAITVNAGVVISSTSASNAPLINFQANGTATGTYHGIDLQPGAQISTVGGNISMTATSGSGGASSEHGINILGPITSITSTSGNIVLNGTSNHGGGGGSGVAAGIWIDDGSISSSSGTVQLTGISNASSTANGQYGISIRGGTLISTVSSTITVNGTSNSTGALTNNDGVEIVQSSSISTQGGNISITGQSNASVGAGVGIEMLFDSSVTISPSVAGSTITMIGTGANSNGTDGNVGINCFDTTLLCQNGTINMTGNGRGNGDFNRGIVFSDTGAPLSSIDATNISMTGNGSITGADESQGISILGLNTTLTSRGGTFLLNGTAGLAGATNTYGVSLNATVISTAAGAVTPPLVIQGTSGTQLGAYGVYIFQGSLSTVDRNVQVDGLSISTGGLSSGVQIESQTIQSTGIGNISITGNGGPGGVGTQASVGLNIIQNSLIEANNGSLTLVGTANPNSQGTQDQGVRIRFTSQIRAVGSAPIHITGTASPMAISTNIGINMLDSSFIETNNGLLTLNGTGGGNGTGGNNTGLFVGGSAQVRSIGTGNLSITAMGGNGIANNHGVDLNTVGQVNSAGGDIEIIGSCTASQPGIGVVIDGMSTGVNQSGSGTLEVSGTGGINDSGVTIRNNGSIRSTSNNAPITVTGMAGTGETDDVFLTTGGLITSTLNSPINVIAAANDCRLEDFGQITALGSGLITMTTARDLIVSGGNTTPGSYISNTTGNISLNVGRDLNVIGGTFVSTVFAQIGNPFSPASGSIDAPLIGRDVNVLGNDNVGWAVIGHGHPVMGSTPLSGDITFPFIGRNLNVSGSTVDNFEVFGFAQIGHIDRFGMATSMSGNLSFNVAVNVNVTGGTGGLIFPDQPYAHIGHGGQSQTSTVPSGNITFTNIGTDLNVFGGTETGGGGLAFAQIGHSTQSAVGNITFSNIGNTATLQQTDLAAYAIVGHGALYVASTTLSGNISFTVIQNDLIMSSATGGIGAFGLTQIGHIAPTGAGATLSGDIFGFVHDSMFFNGGTAAASAYARVGHSGQGGSTVGPSDILLIADHNISLSTTGPGIAQIINESTTANHCNVTLVTDNEFPAPPGIGPYGFFFSQNSLLTANTPNLGFTGQLRIYTARLNQNIVNATLHPHLLGFPINGQTIVFPPEGVDDNFNQFCFYYPNGPYFGPEFVIYYKTPCPPGSTLVDLTGTIIDAQIANDQLRYLLPFKFPSHVFRYCFDQSACWPEHFKMPKEWEEIR